MIITISKGEVFMDGVSMGKLKDAPTREALQALDKAGAISDSDRKQFLATIQNPFACPRCGNMGPHTVIAQFGDVAEGFCPECRLDLRISDDGTVCDRTGARALMLMDTIYMRRVCMLGRYYHTPKDRVVHEARRIQGTHGWTGTNRSAHKWADQDKAK